MRRVPLEQAVGLALGHDITEISVERRIKHCAFRRGHVVAAEDLPRLRDLGKNTLFITEAGDTDVHEDDAARTIAPLIAGANIEHDADPREGKIGFRAACAGLFQVDVERLYGINSLGIPSLPTVPTNFPVQAGQAVAAFRIIPLTCERELVDRVVEILAEPLLRVRPYQVRTAAVIVTGNEVYEGRIVDGFVPRLTDVVAPYGVAVTETAVLPDDRKRIAAEVSRLAAACDLLLVTGGTSVDPDDVTVGGLLDAGVEILTKGTPIQPGNNFTIGYLGSTPVCAVPAAALFHQVTALDIFLPRLLARDVITLEEIHRHGHGGLCLQCPDCSFPSCTFGRGGGA